MNINGTVVTLDLDVQIAKQAGGSYPGCRLAYRDEAGQLKEQCFHNNILKFNAGIKAALNQLSPGTKFTMVKEKEGEFLNVKQIIVGGSNEGMAIPSNAPVKPTVSPKSTYETPEERAARQVMIVRQSSISSAVAALKLDKAALNAFDVLEMAKVFEAYVMGQDKTNSFMDMEDDVPL